MGLQSDAASFICAASANRKLRHTVVTMCVGVGQHVIYGELGQMDEGLEKARGRFGQETGRITVIEL